MRDTDWGPTPCPVCGHTRKAQEHPVCENTGCQARGKNKEEVDMLMASWDRELTVSGAPKSKALQRVECFRTPDGTMHETKESAVASLLDNAFDGANCSSAGDVAYELAENPKLRKEVMDLLGELK